MIQVHKLVCENIWIRRQAFFFSNRYNDIVVLQIIDFFSIFINITDEIPIHRHV
jgi:CO dehydrogenase/acetyl-CoA synthase gamma subunit (corrinoid Fe-S protein)